jgi:hypothetical protein
LSFMLLRQLQVLTPAIIIDIVKPKIITSISQLHPPSFALLRLNSCQQLAATTIDAASNNNTLGLAIPIIDSSNNYAALIYPEGNNLGTVKSSVYINGDSIRQANGAFYLDRNITITSKNQPLNIYNLRLYLEAAELDRIIAWPNTGVLNDSNLIVSKVRKDTCGTGISSAILTDTTFAVSALGNYNGEKYVDINGLKSFSTFYLNSNNVYTFTGNGNWSNPTNWKNGIVPPSRLTTGGRIFIDHIPGGICNLDTTLRISIGAAIIILPGKNLTVPGLLQLR